MNLGGAIHLNKTGVVLLTLLTCFLVYYTLSTTWRKAPHEVSLKKLLQVAVKAAENGGLEVVSVKDNLEILSKGLTKEGVKDSVTTADFKSHCSILGTLLHYFPGLNVVSEEQVEDCEVKHLEYSVDYAQFGVLNPSDYFVELEDVTVWIDPLDATKEYTEKLYKYVTTMVCIAVKGQPVIGVIYKPFSELVSWAWIGHGMSEDLQRIRNFHEEKRIIVSRSHQGKIEEYLKRNFPDFKMVQAAGAGYKVLEVATGAVQAYLHTTAIKKWDLCAGNAIIRAVGGNMTTKRNQQITYFNDGHFVNEQGLVVTRKNHEMFVNKDA